MPFNIHDIFATIKSEVSKAEAALLPATTVKTVQNDFHDTVNVVQSTAASVIKANGWTPVYAAAKDILAGIIGTSPWGDVLAAVTAEAVKIGLQLKAAEIAAITAQAQADGIITGLVAAPMATPQ